MYNEVVKEMVMKKGEMLSLALMKATEWHFGQFDKGGNPYILHPLKVMYYLKTDDEELQCIALLHDVVEDCGVTYQELREMGLSERVIAGIKGMTKLPGETYDDAMNRIKSNPDSIKVKLCDLRHNSDIRRLKGVTEKDIKRIEKYHKMFLELKDLV
jgi:(p)ppGpp synthase/HD superfamily hydrolase